MTGINLAIKNETETKPYAILYSEINGIHIAQLIDETLKIVFQSTEAIKENCVIRLKEKINSLGVVLWMEQSKPDENFIEMIRVLKGN